MWGLEECSVQSRGESGRWTPSEKMWAGAAAAGAGAVAAGLAVYLWYNAEVPTAAALTYGSVAAVALGYRTMRGRGRRRRAAAPWAANGPAPAQAARSGEGTAGGPAWLSPRPPTAGDVRPAAPVLNDPWKEVRSEGERIGERMGTVERVVKALFLLPILVFSFFFLIDGLAGGEPLKTAVAAAVFLATCWFGRKFLSGDERYDVGSE